MLYLGSILKEIELKGLAKYLIKNSIVNIAAIASQMATNISHYVVFLKNILQKR